MTKSDKALLTFPLACILFGMAVVGKLSNLPEHSKKLRQWPPAIPVCDKELWQRVKGDCDG